MQSGYFIDTNILIYARDPQVPEKKSHAIRWLGALADAGLIVVSPQVINEFAHNVIRKLPDISASQLLESLEQLGQWCTASTTAETAISGLAVHRRFRFSFYDSVLIASAMAAGCGAFLSEDLSHDQRIGDLRIINPFLIDPHAVISSN